MPTLADIMHEYEQEFVLERLNGHAWKACVGLHSPQVRILSSPPDFRIFASSNGYERRHQRHLYDGLRTCAVRMFAGGDELSGAGPAHSRVQ